jgi:hypothetical protein
VIWSALNQLIETLPTAMAGATASVAYFAALSDGDFGRLSGHEVGPLLANISEAPNIGGAITTTATIMTQCGPIRII